MRDGKSHAALQPPSGTLNFVSSRTSGASAPAAPCASFNPRQAAGFRGRLDSGPARECHPAARRERSSTMLTAARQHVVRAIPFDAERLDRLMEEAGIDVLVATSKHNVQYLLGGHRAFFFDYMDAMGLSRYLPVMVYPKGAPNKAAYFGHRLENFQRENHPFWTPVQQCNSSGSVDTMQKAVDYIKKSGVPAKAVAAELAFMP